MKCHHCGDTMIVKKIHDYGGYSWGWKCTHCGTVIDQVPVGEPWMEKEAQEGNETTKRNPGTIMATTLLRV